MDIRVNELDLTRAGVISVQRSLPATETSWQVDYSIGDVMYRVQGSAFHGRPHGQDADVLLALQTLFFRAGCPDNNSVEVTAAALLALSVVPVGSTAGTESVPGAPSPPGDV
jgi:plasmid replication initiation protein